MIPLLQKWRRFLPYLGGVAALLLFAAALVVLHRHAQAYRPSEVRSALRTLQMWQPFAALGLAAASYWLLTLYDVLALRHVGRTLPYGSVALASCTAYAFSHAVGFGSIIGPSVRYRVYTPMGLTAGEVAETSGFVIVTFMTGLVAVLPVIALLDPSSLEILGVSRVAGIALGILGLVLMAGYIGLGWWMDRPIRLFGYPLHLPRPRTAVAQIALSVADLSLVAAVLYACLPHASAFGYPHVLAVYVLAFVAGLISHVPGGLGVFDAVVLVGLSSRLPADQILAGLLVDAPAHRTKGEPLEAERHQQAGDDAPGQGPHGRDRHGDDIGQRRIQHEVVAVVDRKRLGADLRDHGGHRDRAGIAEHLVQERAAVEEMREPAAPGLVDGDQRHHRAERHLEADPDERRRIERQHHHRRKRADPHRQPQPVDHDRGEDDPVHDKGALGRHRRAGDDQIAEQHRQGSDGGNLLDRCRSSLPVLTHTRKPMSCPAFVGLSALRVLSRPGACYRVR